MKLQHVGSTFEQDRVNVAVVKLFDCLTRDGVHPNVKVVPLEDLP